jgi:AAA+ ATPase superfamily predicted ATPase
MFVNRATELAALAEWWEDSPHAGRIALVWGRRRVGKTALLSAFAEGRRAVFHTGAGRPAHDELRLLSHAAEDALAGGVRDLGARPFTDWDDALESVAAAAATEPRLLVLDEFPELLRVSPELPGVLRAFWDRARDRTRLRILLCGSAVRTMHAIQEERAPLYGRIDLSLPLHPFAPHETALMLRGLSPADRALVWGILGGIPLYLTWWDQARSVRENLARLVCRPGGQLLDEGQLVLATEGDWSDLGQLVLHAIAAGATKHSQIEQAVRAEPGRRTRRRSYRIADNFLAFWLTIVDPYRAEIERGLGPSILTPLIARLNDHMGHRWEEAFRAHLRRLATTEALAPEVVRIGPFWAEHPPVEIDAVALAGQREEAVLLGEAKWARSADAARIVRELDLKAAALPRLAPKPTYAVCARERLTGLPPAAIGITAADIFA